LTVKTVTSEALQARMERGERFQMIDVRPADEYAAGHIPCAVNLPMDQVESRLDDIHHRDPVVLVCQSGRRATLTRDLLAPHLNDLLVLEGGTAAWGRAGLPLVHGRATRWPLERQVRLAAGLVTAAGALLALLAHPFWVVVPLVTGTGLTIAGLTNQCGMAVVLTRMPWNRPRQAGPVAPQPTTTCCG
jgi:rhodanese-related sulfurtransferase